MAAEVSSSLDAQETSVKNNPFHAFLSEAPSPAHPPLGGTWQERLIHSVGPETPEDKFIHSGWLPIRKKILASLFRTNQAESRIRQFLTCGRGSWIERAHEAPERYRLRTPYCHDRMCLVCGNHRSHKIRDALIQQIGAGPVSFITLTLCGRGEPLKELIDRLFKHFRALRAHPFWAEKVRGGAAILEVKHSEKAHRWHPHLHIIADASFLPQAELSNVWRQITKDSYIVDVRRVRNVDVAGSYVAKYASKPLDSSFVGENALLDEAIEALKGRRLCLCFGTWYGTALSNAEDTELADDIIDAGGYHFFSTLSEQIEQATAGNSSAIALIRATPGAEARWLKMLAGDTS